MAQDVSHEFQFPRQETMRKYGYIGALVALTLSLDDRAFVGAEEEAEGHGL